MASGKPTKLEMMSGGYRGIMEFHCQSGPEERGPQSYPCFLPVHIQPGLSWSPALCGPDSCERGEYGAGRVSSLPGRGLSGAEGHDEDGRGPLQKTYCPSGAGKRGFSYWRHLSLRRENGEAAFGISARQRRDGHLPQPTRCFEYSLIRSPQLHHWGDSWTKPTVASGLPVRQHPLVLSAHPSFG